MLICHRHKFIFLKTKKTAGTSVQQTLLAFCGPDDVITSNKLHYQLPADAGLAFTELGPHAPIGQILRTFGATLADYRIITCERNPVDKLISAYFYKGKKLGRIDETTDYAADFEAKLRASAFAGIIAQRLTP